MYIIQFEKNWKKKLRNYENYLKIIEIDDFFT